MMVNNLKIKQSENKFDPVQINDKVKDAKSNQMEEKPTKREIVKAK